MSHLCSCRQTRSNLLLERLNILCQLVNLREGKGERMMRRKDWTHPPLSGPQSPTETASRSPAPPAVLPTHSAWTACLIQGSQASSPKRIDFSYLSSSPSQPLVHLLSPPHHKTKPVQTFGSRAFLLDCNSWLSKRTSNFCRS